MDVGIRPSAQRLAVGDFVLFTKKHPRADQVLAAAQAALPSVSRATVYNTLNLFVQRGLLQQLVMSEGQLAFDPNVAAHPHFYDEETGFIYDLPETSVSVPALRLPEGFEAQGLQVIVRGKLSSKAAAEWNAEYGYDQPAHRGRTLSPN